MDFSGKKSSERPNTYFVQDRGNEEEITRLSIQDGLLTSGMGGVLSEQVDTSKFRQILDVGCGTGGWLIEAAKEYPTMSRLVGVDVNSKMVAYATVKAEEAQVSDRVQFQVMDALRMLEFPNDTFDLVNMRFSMSYLRIMDWPKMLGEFQRIARNGAVIRVTEPIAVIESNSPAFGRLGEIFLKAMYQSGHLFTDSHRGLLDDLALMLQRYGFENVQTQTYKLECRAGTLEGQNFYENIRHAYRTLRPFFRKWTRVPDDYETIYQQALEEMQQPGFVAIWELLTVWGIPE